METIASLAVLIAVVAVTVVALRWSSSELTPWSALARRFPASTPLNLVGGTSLPGGMYALRGRTGPGGLLQPGGSPIAWLRVTAAGLQLQSFWIYGWRTRHAQVPWSEIQLIASRKRFFHTSFELRLAPGAHLQVDTKAFEAIRQFLPPQSTS